MELPPSSHRPVACSPVPHKENPFKPRYTETHARNMAQIGAMFEPETATRVRLASGTIPCLQLWLGPTALVPAWEFPKMRFFLGGSVLLWVHSRRP